MGSSMTKQVRKKPVALTKDNVHEFLQEFDALLSDCDGVLWTPLKSIPNVKEGLESLKAAGKKIFFVTNNSVQLPFQKFERLGFPVQRNELVYPSLAISQHLESIGFKKKAYVLAVENFREELRQRGVSVVPKEAGEQIKEDLVSMLTAIQDDPEIGAVIVDLDVNVNFIELTRAVNYLKRPDCLFFAGATDTYVSFDGGKILLGPGYFIHLIEQTSGRKADVVGKPGRMMVEEYLKDTHKLDLKRAVFVGDTLVQDMGVANACGMKKLLVLSGMTQLEDLDTCDPELIPDYYIQSIGHFAELLARPQVS